MAAAMLLMGIVALPSCEPRDEGESVNLTILSSTSLTVSSHGDDIEILYDIDKAEAVPEVVISVDWISVFSTSQSGKILLTVDENTSTEARSTSVCLAYGSTKRYVRIMQMASGMDNPILTITSEEEVTIDCNNRKFNIEYTLELATSDGYIYAFADQAWVTSFDTDTEGVITVYTRPNYEREARTATITVGYTHVRKQITLTQTAEGEREFEARKLHGTYYGDQYSPGVGNYFFFLTDVGFNELGQYQPFGTFYRVDAYAPMAELVNDMATIPAGHYTFDSTNSCAEWTFSAEHSYFFRSDEYSNKIDEHRITSGTMDVTAEGITIEWMLDGQKHTAFFEGTPAIPNESATQVVYSTLTEDYEATLDDHYMLFASYGDYYEYGYQNWMVAIKPNNGSGDCFQFDLIAHPTYEEGIAGSFTGSDVLAPMSFIPGWVSNVLNGSWYFTTDQEQVAPFRKGTIDIALSADGIFTIDIDITDDRNHRVTATWSGSGEEVEGSVSSLVLLNAVAPVAQPLAKR